MEERTTYDLMLPCGVLSSDGATVDRRVTVYEMLASTKAALGKKNVRESLAKQSDVVLTGCVASLAGDKNPTKNDFRRLLSADRDFLFLQIRKLSLEPTIKGSIDCAKCGAKDLRMSIPIDKLPIHALPDLGDSGSEMRVVHPDTWEHAVRVFSVENKESEFSGLFRYPTVEDGAEINVDSDEDPFGYFQAAIARCTVQWDHNGSKTLGKISPSTIGKVNLRLLEWLENEWLANQPGPDLSLEVNCSECGNNVKWTLDPSDFFIRERTEERSGKLRRLSSR